MARELARALAKALDAAGVTTMFGVPGGGPNLEMIGAAQEFGIDFVLAHGETAACVMAGTHGRLTGGVGVAIVTRGPGLTSAVNGLAQATLDRAPLVLISDTVPAEQSERTAHQRLDQVATAAPVTKWSGVLGHHDPAATVAAAIELAKAAPQGAVHLAFDPTQQGDIPPVPPRSDPSTAIELQRARDLIAAARRPVIIIGLDAMSDAAIIRAAVANAGVPVLVTYEAKGIIPESSANYAGFFTGVKAEMPLLDAADLILGIGLDSVEPMPGPWPHTAEVVLLHSYPVETAYFGAPTRLVGEYESLLAAVLPLSDDTWPDGYPRPDLAGALNGLPSPSALRPQDLVTITSEHFPDAIVTVDAGAHMLVAMPLWRVADPGSVLISNGLATMGFALPAAIGAATAFPNRKVICFVGDGGLGMSLAELEVLSRRQCNVTVIVFNDASLSLIKLKQGERQGGDAAVGYSPVSFAGIADAMGIESASASDATELRGALTRSAGKPFLIDASINGADYVEIMRLARG
jgi:acetolactate synthase-1/2/3 large subunit